MSCFSCNGGVPTSTCISPCATSEINTAACESLPSQISNFTAQFFGDVTKTEVGGQVAWSLPCNLDVGLVNNPRAVGEGLACYFLRLFEDGILGMTGPQGVPGEDGDPGLNAFTVTTASFTQPSLGAPTVVISTSYNAAVMVGMYVFISTSGYYLVTAVDPSGTIWLTLSTPLSSAPATIIAGKLVVPCGHPGISVTGPTGPVGPQGPQGNPGISYTATNAFYYATTGSTYYIQGPLADRVTFVLSLPEVTIDDGIWLVTTDVEIRAGAGITTTEEIEVKLVDVTTVVDVPGAVRTIRGLTGDSIVNVSFTVRYDGPVNGTTLALYARMQNPNNAFLLPTGVTITAVKLS
jgi:hypothetical protein